MCVYVHACAHECEYVWTLKTASNAFILKWTDLAIFCRFEK